MNEHDQSSRPAAPSGLTRYRCDGPIFDEHNVPRYVDGEWLHRQADVDAELARLRAERDEALAWRDTRHAYHVFKTTHDKLAQAEAEHQRLRERVEMLTDDLRLEKEATNRANEDYGVAIAELHRLRSARPGERT